jgi:two-component system, sensor histidine kinase and response regulator
MHSNRLLVILFLFATQSLAQSTQPAFTDPANRLKTLSQQARQFLDRQQPDSAWQFALKPGLLLLKQLPEQDSAHRVIRQLTGTYYYQRRAFANAIREWTTAVRLSALAADTARQIRSRYELSMVYANLGLNQQSIDESLKNLRLYASQDKPRNWSSTYAMLAVNYEQLGDYRNEEHYTRLALHYARLDWVNDPGWPVLLEAEWHTQHNRHQAAIGQFRRFIQIQARRYSRENVTSCQLQLAQSLQKSGQPDQARQVTKQAIEAAHTDGELTAEAEGYSLLATLYGQRGQPQDALRAARQSVALTWQSGHIVLRPAALKTLANAQERAGQYRVALQTFRQLQQLTDSLSRANKVEVIEATQAIFDVEQKDSQIKLLSKNLIINELEKNQQWLLGWIIIGSLVMGVAITVFFLRRSNRQKRKIETQAAQLAELNGVKDRLFSIVSHDLRGPVMSLKQSLDRLETSTSTAHTLPELPRFRQSVNAVAALTDNVLCWALSQMGGLRTRPQPVGLPELVQDVLALYQETIRQKNIDLIISDIGPDQGLAMVLADENQAEIAIRNIVQNALKFSPVGGTLTLSIESQGQALSLVIMDDGPGFDWQPHQTSTTRASTNSTGLGLTVVEDLMERNGGRLQISRRTDGPMGTVARLTWPVEQRKLNRSERNLVIVEQV